jgi:nicotinamide mononucleotide adenylyltransferase
MSVAKQLIEIPGIINKVPVFIGRLNPMHLGHQAIIQGMIEISLKKPIVFIGSCNAPTSVRHLFNYADRADFIRAVFGDKVRIVPLPDFDDDKVWFRGLDDLLAETFKDAVFIGGSVEDVEFYYEAGRKVHIVNRYSGITKNVNASEVRDALIQGRSISGLVDPRVEALVIQKYPERWAALRNK